MIIITHYLVLTSVQHQPMVQKKSSENFLKLTNNIMPALVMSPENSFYINIKIIRF